MIALSSQEIMRLVAAPISDARTVMDRLKVFLRNSSFTKGRRRAWISVLVMGMPPLIERWQYSMLSGGCAIAGRLTSEETVSTAVCVPSV